MKIRGIGALLALLAFAAAAGACTRAPGQAVPPAGTGAVRLPSEGATPASGSAPATPTVPGTDVDWRIPDAQAGGIEGFADATSVLPGQPVRLFVSTPAPSFTVEAIRLGWYGSATGRRVWASEPLLGRVQPDAVVSSAATGTITAPWQPSLTVATDGWPPGTYLFRLRAATGRASYVPLTVRAASAAGRVVLIDAVTTWQAYNRWGCCDLYEGADGTFATRSRAVSFDRPYANGNGAGEFVNRELPLIVTAERLGLPLDYVTDIDLQADPDLLTGALAAISLGHDEYYSTQMRAALTRARDAGTNLAFLGANAVFRRIRLAATALGPYRLEINYKRAGEDPLLGKDDAQVTADWRDPPDALPESTLTGEAYGCFPGHGIRTPAVVVDAGNWLLAGTGARDGLQLPQLIGPETDAVQPAFPMPRPLEVVLHSPTQCPGEGPRHADATFYAAPSGAGVFDSGTNDWVCAIDASCHVPAVTGNFVRQVTENLLHAFAAGPAGAAHPPQDNLAALGIS